MKALSQEEQEAVREVLTQNRRQSEGKLAGAYRSALIALYIDLSGHESSYNRVRIRNHLRRIATMERLGLREEGLEARRGATRKFLGEWLRRRKVD
jgi:hypothetical protein